jgi:hypothetical protein
VLVGKHRKEFHMKKLSFLTIAICIIGMMALPPAATAELTRLNSLELSRVTGQSGFSFLGGFLGHDMEDSIVSYTNENVEEGTEIRVSMTGEFMGNEMTIESDVEVGNTSALLNSNVLTSTNSLTLKNPTVTMNNFQTNVGSALGISGANSMGMVGFRSMQIRTTGSVRISVN